MQQVQTYELITIVASGLMNHLKNFKIQSDVSNMKSHQEEINFLRQQARSLLDFFLPSVIKDSDVMRTILTEIVAIRVLGSSKSKYSDPQFINQYIISLLETETERKQGEPDNTNAQGLNEIETVQTRPECDETQREDHNRPKKDKWKFGKKKKKSAVEYKALTNIEDSGDDDELKSFCIKLCETWGQKNWTATISEIADNTYRIRVSQSDSSGDELWIVERNFKDFELVGERLCQYPEFEELAASTIKAYKNNKFIKKFKITPDVYIKQLVDLTKHQHCQEALFFLSPFEYPAKGRDPCWDLLKNIHNFEDLFVEEAESKCTSSSESTPWNSDSEQEDNELSDSTSNGSDTELDDRCLFKGLRNRKTTPSRSRLGNLPLDVTPQTQTASQESLEVEDGRNLPSTEHNNQRSSLSQYNDHGLSLRQDNDQELNPHEGNDQESSPSQNNDQGLSHPENNGEGLRNNSKKMLESNKLEERKNEEGRQQEKMFAILIKLLDEILGGNKLINFVDIFGLLKPYKEMFSQSVPKTFTEQHFVWGLDQIYNLLQSNEDPTEHPSSVNLQSKAMELIIGKLKSLKNNKLVKRIMTLTIKGHLTVCHNALQESKRNKETILKLLGDLCRYLDGIDNTSAT
ncbi:uncharacterized protein O3C94_011633 [Discoglossus pictus]